MRTAIIVAPGVGYVGGVGRIEELRGWVEDRVSNGEAHEGERAIRLPRSVTRRLGDWSVQFGSLRERTKLCPGCHRQHRAWDTEAFRRCHETPSASLDE